MDEEFGWNMISAYSRAQAIADGVLVDITDVARECGFVLPCVVTSHLAGDLTGDALKALLWEFFCKIQAGESEENGLCIMGSTLGDVWLHIGPGDTLDPVLTLMYPEDY